MSDLSSQLSDFESQERTLGNHEGAEILQEARVALEQAQTENERLTTVARDATAEEHAWRKECTLETKKVKQLTKQLADVASYEGAAQRKRIEQLEAALHPGKKACDCCEYQTYKGESFWAIDCQCGNHDDIGRAQAWCSMANSYEGATGKSVSAGDSGL